MRTVRMKSGFSLIMAVFFLIIVATLGALALRFTTFTNKMGSDNFLRDQAEFLAISATEYAVMAMQAHEYPAIPKEFLPDVPLVAYYPTSGNCLQEIKMKYPEDSNPLFNIKVTMRYFGLACPRGGGNVEDGLSSISGVLGAYHKHEYNQMALVTTIVETAPDASIEPIRYVRRTLQNYHFSPDIGGSSTLP